MAVDEVDVIELQALERAVDRVHQVLAVERALLVRAVGDAPEELGRDDVAQARPGELLQRLAHDLLALAAGVDLGVVEEIDAAVPRRGHAVARRAPVELVAVRHPRAE
jgi:hypothetical protein